MHILEFDNDITVTSSL